MKRIIATGTGLVAAGALSLGWAMARTLTAPVGPRDFNLTVRDIETSGDQCRLVLDRTYQTAADGHYNLWFEHGGWVRISNEVHARGPRQVARVITDAVDGFRPAIGDRCSWSGIYFASPTDTQLQASEVLIDTPAGRAPAWLVDGHGDRTVWAFHIHGLGSTRAGTLRGVQVATEQGYTSLVISYRNDGEGPQVGSGRSTLGLTEAEDTMAAVEYAIQHGATTIVLFGWSMGAIIALQIATHARYRRVIAGLVLDSPVLNWSEVIRANCKRKRIPAAAGNLATPWLSLRSLAQLTGLSTRIPIRDLDWVSRATELVQPILILHGTRDDSSPLRISEALRDRRPDLVALSTFHADHTLTWNTDPERWRTTVSAWLTNHVPHH